MSTSATTGAQTHPRLCVDASFVLHLPLPDEHDASIDGLWQTWGAANTEVIAPALLFAEVASVLRLRVATGRLTADEGDAIFGAFNALGIHRIDKDEIYPRAWALSEQYQTRRAYDMVYVALAQLEGIVLWTGDERLINTVGAGDPLLRWMPAANPPAP